MGVVFCDEFDRDNEKSWKGLYGSVLDDVSFCICLGGTRTGGTGPSGTGFCTRAVGTRTRLIRNRTEWNRTEISCIFRITNESVIKRSLEFN